MTLPRPKRSVAGKGGVVSPAQELTFGPLKVFAELDQAERKQTAASPQLITTRDVELLLLPLRMSRLQRAGEAEQLAPVERWHFAPDRQHLLAFRLGQLKLDGSGDGPKKRRVSPTPIAQPERPCRLPQREFVAVSVLLEACDQSSE